MKRKTYNNIVWSIGIITIILFISSIFNHFFHIPGIIGFLCMLGFSLTFQDDVDDEDDEDYL